MHFSEYYNIRSDFLRSALIKANSLKWSNMVKIEGGIYCDVSISFFQYCQDSKCQSILVRTLLQRTNSYPDRFQQSTREKKKSDDLLKLCILLQIHVRTARKRIGYTHVLPPRRILPR